MRFMNFSWLCFTVAYWLVDDADLPKLESIELGSNAFSGDNSERRRKENGYASNNTLVMKSGHFGIDGGIDLPSLTSFKCGSGVFAHICSVILESTDLGDDQRRCSRQVIQWYPIR